MLDRSESQRGQYLVGVFCVRGGPVGSVLLALEAKACMTAHIKALPRLYDELNSSQLTVHGAADQAIAAGLAIVNIATAFAKVNLPLVGTYCATKAALLSLGQALRAYLASHGVRVITVMPTTIDTDMSRGANVPKMTKEYVASEILAAIREERYDPPIGAEAKDICEGLLKDPLALEKNLMKYK